MSSAMVCRTAGSSARCRFSPKRPTVIGRIVPPPQTYTHLSISTPEQVRQRARDYRWMADGASSVEIRNALERLAKRFEEFAATRERAASACANVERLGAATKCGETSASGVGSGSNPQMSATCLTA
jgi:hypothetical protein